MNDIYETIYNLKHKDFYNSPGFPAINNDDPIALKVVEALEEDK